MKHLRSFTALLLVTVVLPFSSVASAETTFGAKPAVALTLAKEGQANTPIVVSEKASAGVLKSAKTLQSYLQKISGGAFTIETSAQPFAAGGRGLMVGTAADFAGQEKELGAGDTTRREDYVIRTSSTGCWLAGATDLAVDHAVWDFLYRLGYRQFFPGDDWEIVPSKRDLEIAVDVHEHPDYLARRIWYGFGSMPENMANLYDKWSPRNRVADGIYIVNQHEYASIIIRNRAEFNAHPEYYSLVDGKRTVWDGSQFCISNPGLRKLVVADALRKFEANPNLDSVSVEPNDGGGWCQCPQCLAMGSVTNRVVTLANEVAAAVAATYPGKFVGMLAYNEHSPPPTIKVNPNVVVCVATAFIHGPYTADQLVEAWGKQARLVGIYDYYSFFTWDWDVPGRARVGNTEYLKTTTPRFFHNGARFMNAESSNNWGPNGLGYYLASRLLWDTSASAHVDELIADFLDKAFGPAREPMAEWYHLVDGANNVLLTQDLVGKMYRQLAKALKLTDDPAIRKRIYDLGLYTRYVEMLKPPAAFKPTNEEFMRYDWRIRRTNMVHTWALWTINTAGVPPEAAREVPEPDNPWKSSQPFSAADIEKFISDGVAHNPVVSFDTVKFSHDLVPATPLHLTTEKPGTFVLLRADKTFYTWKDRAPGVIDFQATSGVASGNRPGEAVFTLYSGDRAEGTALGKQELSRDNQPFDLEFETKQRGLHTVAFGDGDVGTRLTWPEGTALTFEASLKLPYAGSGVWSLYFYVPKGTKTVGGYRICADGRVAGPDGQVKMTFDAEGSQNFWSVPVGPGEDGKLWEFQNISGGEMRLLTVPPYLARSAGELLLPKEVVEADR